MTQARATSVSTGAVLSFYAIVTVLAFGIAWVHRQALPVDFPGAAKLSLPVRVAAGAAAGLGIHYAGLALDGLFEWSRALSDALARLVGTVDTRRAAIMAGASGLGEELLFRGALMPWIGLAASALVFGLLHVGPDRRYLPWTVMAVGMGFVFGLLMKLTGDIVAPVVAHVTINYFGLLQLGRRPETGAA
jgi:membrane protease YdiL (CAAX protease family)